MEKYSRWSDLTTGINPFVAPPHQLPSNIVLRWTQILFGGILALLRWILLAPLLLVLAILHLMSTILAFMPFVGRLFERTIDLLVVGSILVVATVFIKDEPANARRLGLLAPGSKPPALSGVKAGDVIVCNHTSVFDVIYMAYRYSPTFVYPSAADASKGLVHSYGLFQALGQAMAPPLDQLSSPVKLQDVVRRASKPVVVFAEGTRSNGKGVLRFLPVLDTLPEETRIHVVAIKFEFKAISPTHTCGSALWHLCRLFSHAYHTMKVTTLPAEFVSSASASATTIPSLLASMLRTKCVDLSTDDFISFNKYWSHVQGGGRDPASAFTTRKAPHEHAQWKTN
ncbi:unnamed protein product [Aphanomyces euteiches]|uniref:Phospholipid/glycerol acyltransferase domain-containing protein n=1 Tax=Aphanomyces euteiches TaxID=100861 RepID=A0A6G0WAM2_9STRA|nr:hypothetical protein Ae201684_016894 [Aphanomyces euteiches]